MIQVIANPKLECLSHLFVDILVNCLHLFTVFLRSLSIFHTFFCPQKAYSISAKDLSQQYFLWIACLHLLHLLRCCILHMLFYCFYYLGMSPFAVIFLLISLLPSVSSATSVTFVCSLFCEDSTCCSDGTAFQLFSLQPLLVEVRFDTTFSRFHFDQKVLDFDILRADLFNNHFHTRTVRVTNPKGLQ